MKKSLWRLAAAGLGASVALAMSAGTAGATSAHEPSRWSGRQHSGHPAAVHQLGSQESHTTQQATSEAKSTQLAPTNVNAPISLLGIGFGTGHHAKGGHGKDGGSDIKQSNHSQAASKAKNTARTVQVMDQDQQVHARPEPVRPGHHGEKPHRHDRGCEHGKWWKQGSKPGHGHGHGKGHGVKPHHGHHDPKAGAVQSGEQKAHTEQDADSTAKSTQVLPVNVNAPIQVLSLGSNGGDVEQSNSSKAESEAGNHATTQQGLQQDQRVPGGFGPGGAVQSGEQEAATEQDADSSATSTQVLPVNVNVPLQVLSLGSNGGDVSQSNSSSAQSEASNSAGTAQGLLQQQLLG